MGFTKALAGTGTGSDPETPRRSPTGRRKIGDVNHRRPGATACSIESDHGELRYGPEVPVHFEVSPRPVQFRAGPDSKLSILAINRLEATIQDTTQAKLWHRKHLVIAAWPYSFGMVAACRFRTRIKTNREKALLDLADRHRGDLFGLLRELDGLDDDLLPETELPAIEPTLTVPGQVLAGRYLLDRFDPANFQKRTRFSRSKQNKRADGDPGWVLGLCDWEASLSVLLTSSDRIGREAWTNARLTDSQRSDASLRKSVTTEAVPLACSLALAGYCSESERQKAVEREGPRPTVIQNTIHICGRLIETRVASEQRAAKSTGTSTLFEESGPEDEHGEPQE